MHSRFLAPAQRGALLIIATGLLLSLHAAHAKPQRHHGSATTGQQVSAKAGKSGKGGKTSVGRARKGAKSVATHNGKLIDKTYADNPAAMAWAEDAAARLSLPVAWLRQQVSKAHRLPLVEQLVLPAPSPVAKNWTAYRARFIEPKRIEAGVAFWSAHQSTLARAEQTYGVPAHIIVGILGVETLYGQNTGNFRVLDALTTLAFDFPSAHPRAEARQAFFRSELEHFMLLTQRNGTDPQSLRGSFAGAMGLPQFMPSSWSRYAIDFDGDGRVDLFNSSADAIGSVAHYFQAFQWKSGLPTHYPVTLTPSQNDMDALLAPDISPTFSVEEFTRKGAQLEGAALQHPGKLALIELRNGPESPSYVAGTDNFYAITRYNWSAYYAMAVIELGQAVAQRMGR